jgi:hypothetical protein
MAVAATRPRPLRFSVDLFQAPRVVGLRVAAREVSGSGGHRCGRLAGGRCLQRVAARVVVGTGRPMQGVGGSEREGEGFPDGLVLRRPSGAS